MRFTTGSSAALVAALNVALMAAWPVGATVAVPAASTAAPTCQGLPATIVGTAGDDDLTGTSGSDVIVGGAGADTIDARGGDDVVCGGADGDDLRGGAGDDALDAGSPDQDPGSVDLLDGGPDDDTLRGNVETFADYRDATAGVRVDLGAGRATGMGTDMLIGVPDLYGSPFADVLVGNAGANEIRGGEGADEIRGLAGHDDLYTNAYLGDDGAADRLFAGPNAASDANEGDVAVLDGGGGRVQMSSGFNIVDGETDAGTVIVGGPGTDYIRPEGSFTAYGGDGTDDIFGGYDDDEVIAGYGQAGDDQVAGHGRLIGGQGDDTLSPRFVAGAAAGADGGPGRDTLEVGWPGSRLDVRMAPLRYRLDLADWRRPAWSSIEKYGWGLPATTTITGSPRDDIPIDAQYSFVEESLTVRMGGGDDRIAVRARTWDIDLGSGDDTLAAIFGDGPVRGGAGDDRMRFLRLRAGQGATFDGGAGDDELIGDDGRDRLAGGDGNDVMRGEDAADRLYGGPGIDSAYGGAGNDRCRAERRTACEAR